MAYEGKTKDKLTIQNDSMDSTEFREFLVKAFGAISQYMEAGAAYYIWHASSEAVNFICAANETLGQVREQLVWVKQSMVLGRQDYQYKHEPCLYGWKEGGAHKWYSDRSQTTVLEFQRPSRNDIHPTMKPVELFEYQIKNSTKKGDEVFDSFGGSGTTIIACENTGRKARVIELSPKYCDAIIKRWQNLTHQDAIRADGIKFNDLSVA